MTNLINLCLSVIFISGCCFGLNQNETHADTTASPHTQMKTLMKKALSNNTALVDILGDGDHNRTQTNSMKSLTLSALGTPSISWNQFLYAKDTNSVPVPTGGRSANSSVVQRSDRTRKVKSTKLSDKNNSSVINETSPDLKKTEGQTMQGIYIPMEKLSRTRRQVPTRAQSLSNRRRVLFLLNSNMSRPAVNRTALLRPGLFLVRNNNTLQQPGHRIGQVRLPSEQRQVSQNPGRNRLRDIRRQPAIQSIDLRKVDLDAASDNTSSVERRGSPRNTLAAASGISVPRNATTVRINSTSRTNLTRSTQNTNSRRQPMNTSRRLPSVQPQSANTRRRPNALSSNIQRPLLEPRLTHEQPVRSGRIALLLRPNVTTRGNTSSFVRTVLPSTARRVVVNPNRLAVQNRQSTRQVSRGPRVNAIRVPGRTQRTQRTQRQPARRVPRPVDPFTQRFSAGFQRGSQLLHQPDSGEIRGFDGSVRVDRNFRNRGVGGPFRGLPQMRPGLGNGFGGFGIF